MGYARWATQEEVVNRLKAIDINDKLNEAGIPIAYDQDKLYIDVNEAHNLIIGSTGSGKTQALILPMLELSMKARESVVINDPKGDVYKMMAGVLRKNGYKINVIDYDDAKKGNCWNPLKVPYDLYKNGYNDKAIKCLEDVGYYLFYDINDKDSDPFWVNSTINYFLGIALYLFDNAKEDEVNLESVYRFSDYLSKKSNSEKVFNSLNSELIRINFSGILDAPMETRGSIMSVFNQRIRKYISRIDLANMLSSNDIDIKNINKDPTILFIISGTSNYCNNLIPLLVNQIIDYALVFDDKKLSILLDEFDSMVPIRDFSRIIEDCRSLRMRITVTIRSYVHLCNMYSKEEAEILKMCFGNLIYLLSDDIYTLEEVSRYCGKEMVDGNLEPLITVEDLKTMNVFEGIVIMPRMMPIKTKFLPFYKFNIEMDEYEDIPAREENIVKVYEEKE